MRSRGDRGHVDGDERPLPAAAEVGDGTRDEFLAGAAFADDRHREVGLRHAPMTR